MTLKLTSGFTRTAPTARRPHRWAVAAGLLAVLAGCGGGAAGPAVEGVALPEPTIAAVAREPGASKPAAPKVAAPKVAAPKVVAPQTAAQTAAAPRVDAGTPIRVRIPRLGIDASLQPLKLGRAGELVPPAYGRAGWYEAGPEPGELGRAVIAGHVDSKTGPDVFAALSRARPGDRIRVLLGDRSTVTFVVQAVEVHPRKKFPTARVYGTDGQHAELRLITCTGAYDRARGGYQDNVVVFARAVK